MNGENSAGDRPPPDVSGAPAQASGEAALGRERRETAPETFLDGRVRLHCGDCLAVLDAMPANSVDAVVTDPPYHFDTIVARFGAPGAAAAQHGLDGAFARASAGFMGKQWDGGDIAFRPETWARVLRVLKPGGHMAAFAAPKCVHKMAFAIEAAGFEVRDRVVHLADPDPALAAFLDSLSLAQADALFRLADRFGALGEAFWIFGQGFPKSHDVSKAIDKLKTGVVRGAAGKVKERTVGQVAKGTEYERTEKGDPITPEVAAWQGWGTALKPAYEPIVIARKPSKLSVATQVLKTGTGALNLDACRIGTEGGTRKEPSRDKSKTDSVGGYLNAKAGAPIDAGRFPANLAHDGSPEVQAGFPDSKSTGGDGYKHSMFAGGKPTGGHGLGDDGSAARFFYTAKAGGDDRLGAGHPTVKPLDLMQWLVRMLTPPGGAVLDPFAGTGTTAEAAFREGFSAVLIEREAEYQADIRRRMEHLTAGPTARRVATLKARAARQKQDATPAAADDFPADLLGGTGGA